MLPCVCSVIDHRWRQNVVGTKKWHTRHSGVCHWCSYHILTSSVIYYWADARQHEIYLLYIITKGLFYFKIFQHNAEAGLCPAFGHFGKDQKSHFKYSITIQNEAISLVTEQSKELWLVEENHATVKPDLSVAPREMKTYSISRTELQNLNGCFCQSKNWS